MTTITVRSAVFGLPSKSILFPPKNLKISLTIPPLAASAYVNRKPIATDDISIGMNQSTLQIVDFFPANSMKVASARPIGIWMIIDKTIMMTLLRNASQKFISFTSFAQLRSPTKVRSTLIPLHLYPLIRNESTIG